MAATCWSSIRGNVMRATRVDACGAFVTGPGGMVVSDGFVEVSYSMEIDEGTEVIVKKANGDFCINEPGRPLVKWVNVEAHFCNVDPDLMSMFTGWPTVVDCAGDGVGFRVRESVLNGPGVALEVWTDVTDQPCDEGNVAYGYFLTPWLTQGILGDLTIKEDAIDFVITAKTRKGSAWGVGPYLVDMEEGSVPETCDTPSGLLTPIGPLDHMDIHLTHVAPPAAACGAQTLVDAA